MENEHSRMPITAVIIDDSSVMREIVERSLRQAGVDLLHDLIAQYKNCEQKLHPRSEQSVPADLGRGSQVHKPRIACLVVY